MGTGHLMRCLALAQGWRASGGEARFAVADAPERVASRVAADGFPIERVEAMPGTAEDADRLVDIARARGAEWLALDGYHFAERYQSAIRGGGFPVLAVDDNAHAESYVADVVLNQNMYAREEMYASRAPYTRLLLGSRYALLRSEFRERVVARSQSGVDGSATRVLVTLGGSDPHDTTSAVLGALSRIDRPELEVRVVVGPANARIEAIRSAAAMAPFGVELLGDVRDMPSLMEWCDLAISAAGSTCWELAHVGVPMLVVSVAENQLPIAESLAAADIGIDLGWYEGLNAVALVATVEWLLDDGNERREMSARARALVDGEGALRVAAELRSTGVETRGVGGAGRWT
jgi:UDP-2,4-diacetamido-2,4,6-trideoxy-beta-L-altropyranose hydrolase